ncbi:hypothetical protein BS78_10G182500 [Paspalum vaginatum]|nr:hypothetical protein BS78_10G182500 [Paspalum vaginatum]
MNLFGDEDEYWDPLTPSSNPRPVNFFNESQRSVAGHGGSGGEGLDLNSQAVDFPNLGSYSALLQGDAGVDGEEGASRRGRGYGRPGNNQGAGRGVVERRAISAGGAPAMATYPSRFPPMGARGGRGGHRGGSEAPGSSIRRGGTPRAPPLGKANVNIFDKAAWNAKNTIAFCDICIEEITARNKHGRKYMLSTGLRHSKTQLKNRLDQLKKLYAFWLWLNKRTGNGAIFYDDSFWKKHAKGKTEWKRLRYGPPDCLHQLERMFANTAVDGSTVCIPGEHNDEEASTENQRESNDGSPLVIGKRTNMGTCVTNPIKKVKSPMVKIMKGFVENMQSSNDLAQKVMQGDAMVEAIKKAMTLVVECGAVEGSVEHFVASKILVKPENRAMFFTLTTNEGRLAWLKRWCKDKNID